MGSIIDEVHWIGPPTDPFLAVTDECKFTQSKLLRWMLRIVDVEKALEQRGFDPTLKEELHLEVHDDLLPENAGRYVLNIEQGHCTVTRGGRGDLSATFAVWRRCIPGCFRRERLTPSAGWTARQNRSVPQIGFSAVQSHGWWRSSDRWRSRSVFPSVILDLSSSSDAAFEHSHVEALNTGGRHI